LASTQDPSLRRHFFAACLNNTFWGRISATERTGTLRGSLFAAGMALALAGPSFANPAMTGAPVTMHAAPNGKSRVVQRIPANAEIDLSTCGRGWCQASWRHLSGYIPAEAVVLGPPPATAPGNEMPPPVLSATPTNVAPPTRQWTGPYVGTNFGFGSGSW
jgi:hypothetical protein